MEETLIKRIMPNSLEAEQSVIGSMIMDKDAILTAMEMLNSEDFYHRQYGVLFDAMIELYSKGLPVDLITLQNKLKEKDVPPGLRANPAGCHERIGEDRECGEDDRKCHRYPDRFYRSGLPDSRIAAVRPDSGCSPSFYGKDGIRFKYCTVCGIP